MSDPIYTVRQAAAYCGITPSGLRKAIQTGPEEDWPWVDVVAPVNGALRTIRGVRKSVLDTYRAQGFLVSRTGRRKAGRTREGVARFL